MAIIAILLILLIWLLTGLSSQTNIPSDTSTVIPASDTPAPTASTPQECRPGSVEGEFTCSDPGQPEYTIALAKVPQDVTPKILPVSDQEEANLRDLPTDGIACVVSIAGNLVFYEKNDNDKLVTNFSTAVQLTLNYTAADKLLLQPDIKQFLETSENAKLTQCLKDKAITAVEEIVPIYLYSPAFNPSIRIWKPFQNFSPDNQNNKMTVEFLYWGDQPIGGGTRP
jgi:hypothetical protein